MTTRTTLLLVCSFVLASQVSASLMSLEDLLNDVNTGNRDSKESYELLDEFTSYFDRLSSPDGISQESADYNEMKREFESMYRAVYDSSKRSKENYVRDPRQRQSMECGKYGCCDDGSMADVTRKIGCAKKLCANVLTTTCFKKFGKQRKNGDRKYNRECDEKFWIDHCPHACSSCRNKLLAPPKRACELLHPGERCCWDGERPLKGSSCRVCNDLYSRACKTFSRVAGGCISGSYRIRMFMKKYCPKTCGLCL